MISFDTDKAIVEVIEVTVLIAGQGLMMDDARGGMEVGGRSVGIGGGWADREGGGGD